MPDALPYKTDDIVLATCLSMAGLPLTHELREGRSGSAWFVFPSIQNNMLKNIVSMHATRELRVDPVRFHDCFAKVRRELMEFLDKNR